MIGHSHNFYLKLILVQILVVIAKKTKKNLQELQIILLMVLLRKEVKDLLVRTKMTTVKAVHHRTKMEVVIARQIMNLFAAAKILQTNWLQVWASFMLDHQKLIMAGMKIQSLL